MSFHVRWPAPQGLPGRQSDARCKRGRWAGFPSSSRRILGRGHYPDAFDFRVWI